MLEFETKTYCSIKIYQIILCRVKIARLKRWYKCSFSNLIPVDLSSPRYLLLHLQKFHLQSVVLFSFWHFLNIH